MSRLQFSSTPSETTLACWLSQSYRFHEYLGSQMRTACDLIDRHNTQPLRMPDLTCRFEIGICLGLGLGVGVTIQW